MIENIEAKAEYVPNIGQGWTSGNNIIVAINKSKIDELELNEFGEVKFIVGKRIEASKGSKSDWYVSPILKK
jgi:hypothetical protein